MNLRIFRKLIWKHINDGIMGGKLRYKLVEEDELQQQNEAGEWVPVPVFLSEEPPHPDTIRPAHGFDMKGRAITEAIRKFKEQQSPDT